MTPSGPVQGICELVLEARDLRAMEGFYREVFRLRVISRDADRVWLAVGDRSRLGLWTPGPKEFDDQGGRHVHFAFVVTPGGLPALVERAAARGATVEGPHEHEGGDRSVYVTDPEGNVVEAWDFFTRGAGRREGVEALRS